jgi:HK97 family phage prohead protease
MIMADTLELRRSADRRRAAADQAGERDGDAGYRRYRSQVPGLGAARPSVTTAQQLRAEPEQRNGQNMIHTWGAFTTYGRGYEMWDDYGKYHEFTDSGSGRITLASNPDVAFLVNHKGVAMARTRARNRDATLVLVERAECGWHDGWLNPDRQDVRDLYSAIKDGLITEMSFAFMIPDGGGWWTDDFTEFHIRCYDIDRGDVSAVNFGANPHTDIAARGADVLRELRHLPRGAQREAMSLLGGGDLTRLHTGEVTTTLPARVEFGSIEVDVPRRERIAVQRRSRPVAVDPAAPRWMRARQWRVANTARRMVELAETAGLQVRDLPMVKLPWYEIRERQVRAVNPGDQFNPASGDTQTETDVLIYDEIGGSFGVSASEFADDIAGIDSNVINLRINSPGGSVRDATAIHSSLLHHPARVRSYVDGIAASAASVIALAGDEIITMPGAQWMLHDASTMVDGNEAELKDGSEWIGRQSQNIADLYAKRMGITSDEARALMLAETWAFADESVEMGLADKVFDREVVAWSGPAAERMRRRWDLTHFRYAGRAKAPAPSMPRDRDASRVPPAAPGPGPTEQSIPAVASIPAVPDGRSIQLIEALLDLED